ncbi:type I restriction endonuclease [Sedimenticola selenatireducens]|uniref:type I restriction endonuclease subunit R n=1 Tax=Sedimenticola selenatireducens TaxID=191960 RepID=UPI002AAC4C80|nr:type I restriction endonuclease [Sedimenticola selenatireducens]
MTKLNEAAYERSLCQALVDSGYDKLSPDKDWDVELALCPNVLLDYIRESQPDAWKQLQGHYGASVDAKVIDEICRQIKKEGMLAILRNGIRDRGVAYRLVQFAPPTSLNPDVANRYALNRMGVMQQVRFDSKTQQTIDVVLFVNGLPLATIELKNAYTGQTATNAIKQYMRDRKPKSSTPLIDFNQRALVHFAADTAECYMTTRLDGDKTYFLPFNKGNNGRKGNPVAEGNYSTHYLWDEVWKKDAWLDLLQNYIVLERQNKSDPWRKGRLIFPRYHQWQCVRRLIAESRKGLRNYLNQHSAGSGKTNTISWVTHQLSTLHDENNKTMYDGVIVVSDRRNLDKQLQDAISNIDRKEGVVECIVSGSNESKSSRLRDAIKKGTRVIVTTLQTFRPMLEGEDLVLEGKRYALVVDEAHSSQSGKAAAALRAALGDAETTDSEALEDLIVNQIVKRGPQTNLAFYAFTATPKPKTLEMFGDVDANGEPVPFSLYSMQQAIDEGFILDVLKNYVTYDEMYEIVKSTPDDPVHEKSRSKKQIARFASLHEAAVEQKVTIIVEHFRERVLLTGKIKGMAKAMVVTRSRLHAVRYFNAFQKYIAKQGYEDLRTLVAFSGTVDDQGEHYTETSLNGFDEAKTPEKFDTHEYQVLIVAEKYQTGFDQPLLHTMYVDKVLGGIQAVQTLSRLNRCHPDKKDTCVVDFVNDRETIYKAFKPYYDVTSIDEVTNPNHVYNQQSDILSYGLIRDQEIEGFAEIYFKKKLAKGDTGHLDALVQAAVKRFIDAYGEHHAPDIITEGDNFKGNIRAFLRLYEFVTQVTRFVDMDLEKFYLFVKHLLPALPFMGDGENEDLSHEIELKVYRADFQESGEITLDDGTEADPLHNPSTGGGGGGKPGELLAPLSEIIREFNERYGLNFREEDIHWMHNVEAETETDDVLIQQAKNSDPSAFKTVYDEKALDLLIDKRERDEELFDVLISNDGARGFLFDKMRDAFLRRVLADVVGSSAP